MGLFAPLGQETAAHGAHDFNDAHLGLIGVHAGVGLGLVSVEQIGEVVGQMGGAPAGFQQFKLS
jgi:hypothetical protein